MKEIQQIKNKLIIDSSIPVINNPKILNYLCDIQSQSFKHNKKNLSKNLLDELKSSFGKHNKCLRLEFMTKVWILKYDDLTFNVFTAKGKGTSIEICGYNHEEIRLGKKQNEIMEFLERLHEMINNIVRNKEKLFKILSDFGFEKTIKDDFTFFRFKDEIFVYPNELQLYHYISTRKQLDMNGWMEEKEFNLIFETNTNNI